MNRGSATMAPPRGAEGDAAPSAWLETPSAAPLVIQSACSLGRAASNNLALPGEKVSRRHALIQGHGENDYWLTDLGSSNGTYLNGRPLSQAARLYDQDQIAIGPHRLVFHNPGGPKRPVPETSVAEVTVRESRSQYCWLLLVELQSATRLAESRPPDQVPTLMGQWLDQGKAIIETQGGRINRYLGAGLLAFWQDHALVRTAVAQALSDLKEIQASSEPRFRIQLHYGEVALVDSPTSGELHLTGPAVHFLFRMQKLSETVRASGLVSEVAQALLKPQLPLFESGLHSLNGFEGEQLFYRL